MSNIDDINELLILLNSQNIGQTLGENIGIRKGFIEFINIEDDPNMGRQIILKIEEETRILMLQLISGLTDEEIKLTRDEDDLTLLDHALKNGHNSIAQMLYNRGLKLPLTIDIIQDWKSKIENGDLESFQALPMLYYNLDQVIEDPDVTLLSLAASCGNIASVKLLLKS